MVYKAPAKRSQCFNATYRNIVGCNRLRAFGHPVATCCDMLGVVGCNNVAPGQAHLFDFN